MLKPENIPFSFRDYGELIICYSKLYQKHFLLENVFADFFRYFYVSGKPDDEVIELISKEYGVTKEQVDIDFREFLEEMSMLSSHGNLHSEEDSIPSQEMSDNDIYNYMSKATIPFSATIEITDRCNLNCIHCYRGDPQKTYWNVKTWRKVLDELKNLGTLHLTITGGEPFSHPQIAEMLEVANDKGFVITIQTNATYDLKKVINILQKATIKMVFISLYSTSDDIHDMITNQPGSLTKTKKNIEYLVDNKIPVSVNCPVMIYNQNDMAQIKSFCNHMGIKCNFAFKIIPSQQQDRKTLSLNCFSAKFLYDCIHDSNIKLYENELKSIRKTIPGGRYCQTGFRSITFSAQGDVLLCNAFRKVCGNIKDNSVADIWATSQVLNDWRNTKSIINAKCKQCKAYAYCEPCPAHAYTLTGNDNDIDELSCAFGKALYDADNQHSLNS